MRKTAIGTSDEVDPMQISEGIWKSRNLFQNWPRMSRKWSFHLPVQILKQCRNKERYYPAPPPPHLRVATASRKVGAVIPPCAYT